MRYRGRPSPLVISLAIVYAGIKYLMPNNANAAIIVLLVLFFLGMFLRKLIINYLYKCSINIVPKVYVVNFNTIQNNFVTVTYTPNKKIVVMDSATGPREEKRLFTVQNIKNPNVNELWNKVCKMFDNYTNLDSLATYINYSCDIIVAPTVISRPKPQPKTVNIQKKPAEGFVEMNSIEADKLYLGKTEGHKGSAELLDFDNMNKQKVYEEKSQNETETFDISDIANKYNKKIDVNTADASEISILPGINIAMAKKLVEMRNINGFFRTEDDFIAAAEVKEHFVKQIKNMIIVSKPVDNNSDGDDSYNDGRIVDL